MTNNHLLLYRLAELMLKKQQHILALDDLFEDEQIGAFVRSIQIDSPYQQLIFEGVLTETIKEERIMVTFTVEGYFHYVLGEVIEPQTLDKRAEALKDLLENNQLRGITEGVEQCLVRDVEKNDLSRLMWLIDEGGKALEASAYPLAQAFLIYPIERVMDELLADPTDNDINVLEKAIKKLESAQLNQKVSDIYKQINNQINPDNIKKATLYVKSIKHIPTCERVMKLKKLNQVKFKEISTEIAAFHFSLAEQFEFISEYEEALKHHYTALLFRKKTVGLYHNLTALSYNNIGLCKRLEGKNSEAIIYYKKSLEVYLKSNRFDYKWKAMIYNNIGVCFKNNGSQKQALDHLNKAYEIYLMIYGMNHQLTATSLNNIGNYYNSIGQSDKAILNLEKALYIDLKLFGYHTSTGITYNNLGNCYKKKMQYTRAKEYYNLAYDIFQKKLGKEHRHALFVQKKLKDLNDQ